MAGWAQNRGLPHRGKKEYHFPSFPASTCGPWSSLVECLITCWIFLLHSWLFVLLVICDAEFKLKAMVSSLTQHVQWA